MAVALAPYAIAELIPNAYLTDGRSLFRVVAPIEWRDGRVRAELEDCLTLSSRVYWTPELRRMSLTLVRAARPASA